MKMEILNIDCFSLFELNNLVPKLSNLQKGSIFFLYFGVNLYSKIFFLAIIFSFAYMDKRMTIKTSKIFKLY